MHQMSKRLKRFRRSRGNKKTWDSRLFKSILPFVLFYAITGNAAGHIQALIFTAVCFIVGFQVLMIGLPVDVISFNRRLIEETLVRVRRMEFDREKNQSTNTHPD